MTSAQGGELLIVGRADRGQTEPLTLPTSVPVLRSLTSRGWLIAECGPADRGLLLRLRRSSAQGIAGRISATTAGLTLPPEHLAGIGAEAGAVDVTVQADGRLRLRNDGAGFLPFYWASSTNGFWGSTSMALLVKAGAPVTWDEASTMAYLSFCHPLGDTTLLDGVKELPAGATLEWNPADPQATTMRNQALYHPKADLFASDEEAVRSFRAIWPEILADIAHRNHSRKIAVGVSGGLDSRAIISGFAEMRVPVLGVTYTSRRNRETDVADAVASTLGVDHLRLPITEQRLLDNWTSALDDLDGCHSPAEMYERWFRGPLTHHADVLVSGLWGGPLWGGDKAFGLTSTVAVAEHVLHRSAPLGQLRSILVGDLRQDADRLLRAAVEASLLPHAHRQGQEDLSVFWNLDSRQRRWGLALGTALRRQGQRLEAPFLDSRFLQFSARLTPDQRRNGRLHLAVQREVFATTAKIPRGNDGNAPADLSHLYWTADKAYARQLLELGARHPLSAGRRAGGRAKTVVAGRFAAGPGTWSARVNERESLFDATRFAAQSPIYRGRLADMLASAAQAGHPLLDDVSLMQESERLRRGIAPTASPLVLARAASLALWRKSWTNA